MSPAQPWSSEDVLPEKPDPRGYGYKAGKEIVHCSRDELVAACSRAGFPLFASSVDLVWTPATARMVPPEALPELHDALRRRHRATSRRDAVLFLLCFVAFLVIVATMRPSWRSLMYLTVFFGGPVLIALGVSVWELRRWESLSIDPERALAATRFEAWIRRREPILTAALIVLIVIVSELGFGFGRRESVEAAGLVKDRFGQGELWRGVTCALLHANSQHVFGNVLALLWSGRTIEAVAHRAYVPFVFLVSVAGGSLASALLSQTPSVGASGGIMGLVGFLLALALRGRRTLPQGFAKSIMGMILVTAVFGLLGFEFIDNAAHAGGLAAGFLQGMACLGRDLRAVPTGAPRAVVWLGYASLAALGLAALQALAAITAGSL